MRGKLRAGILSTVALFSLAFAPAAAHNRSRPTQDCHEWTGVAAALLVSDFVLGRAAVGGGEPAPRRPPGAPRPRIVPRTLRSRARPRPPASRRDTMRKRAVASVSIDLTPLSAGASCRG